MIISYLLHRITDIEFLDEPTMTLVPQDSNHAELFKLSQMEGFSNSLLSYTLPMFVNDRSKSGAIKSGESQIHTSQHRNVQITYNAVPIIDSKGNQQLYYATGQAQTVFEAIIELIGEGSVDFEQTGKHFVVTFRLQTIRDYLESKGKSINGSKIANCIEILKKANVDVSITTEAGEKITYSGTYLQSAKKLDSHIPSRNGMYRAVIHPAFADNIIRGNYRFIEKEFITSGKTSKLFAALIHIMRHKFLNASALNQDLDKFSFTVRFSDVCFAAGFKAQFTQATGRRNLQELTQIMIDAGIIARKTDFKRKKVHDVELGFDDIECTIFPTIQWGKSQKKSNHHFKTLRDNIKKIEVDDLEAHLLLENTQDQSLHETLELPPIESYSDK